MAENYKHLYEQMKKMVAMYQDEIVPGMREQLEKCVEVVRCKDCKHWNCRENDNPNLRYFCNADALYAWGRSVRCADDFCSHGERKDNVPSST